MIILNLSCQVTPSNNSEENQQSTPPPPSVTLDDPSWSLTWSDEFDGTGNPDSSKWETAEYERKPHPERPDGWWDADFVRLDGQGNLEISVDKVPNRNSDTDEFDYAVGMVRSRGRFSQTYGKFEARCRLPEQAGWWVAFWLFPDNGTGSDQEADGNGKDGTEIDVMEGYGWTDRIQSALHYDGYGTNHQSDHKSLVKSGIRNGFHTYTLIWTQDSYTFYVDGEETWQTDFGGVSQVPSYIKLTGEISTEDWATTSGWANAIPEEGYPDNFLVDYVRVYQYK